MRVNSAVFQAVLILFVLANAVFFAINLGKSKRVDVAPASSRASGGGTDYAANKKREIPVVELGTDHVRGDKNARIAMVEYSDLECPYCKQFQPIAQQLLDMYKGNVFWIYRHYPLASHKNAFIEAEAAECAADIGGSDKFWQFVDAVFSRTTSNGTGFPVSKLRPLAEEIGLDGDRFGSCLENGKFSQKINAQERQGEKEGVFATPGIILVDTKTGQSTLIPGVIPLENMKHYIDNLLNQ